MKNEKQGELNADPKSKKSNIPVFCRPRKTKRDYMPSKELPPGSTVMKNNKWVTITIDSESKKYLKNNFEDSQKYKAYEFDENKLINYKRKHYNPKLSFVLNNTFILSFSNQNINILYLNSQN